MAEKQTHNPEMPPEGETGDETTTEEQVVGGPVEAAAEPTPEIGAVDDGAATGGDDEPEVVEEADPLAEAEQQRDIYLDLLRRERAEFENFRRRMNKERMEALDRGAEQLVASLLGVLDNFGFVLEAAKDSQDEQLTKGAQMVHRELVEVLQRAGLEQVPGEGEPFDPTWHEAMMQVEADEPVDQPVVAEVLRPGYRFKNRVLRPASVSVAQ